MFEPVTVEITRATPDRVHELAALIGHAFSDDPIALWSLAPEATEEQVRLWFLWFDEVVAPLGMLWEAGRGLGAAVWFPPGKTSASSRSTARFAGWWLPSPTTAAPGMRPSGIGSGSTCPTSPTGS